MAQDREWVLITGASSGIGEVFARRFAAEGWNTILAARSRDKLEALASNLADQFGVETLVLRTDLTDENAPKNVYDNIKAEGIELHGLVNNAGFGISGRFHKIALSNYLSMIDLNVRALVELTGLFLPEMVKRDCGLVLNVSSTASYQPLPYNGVYAATKAFVTSFTEALWLEVKGTNVRILNLCPGITKTNFGTSAGMHNFHKDPKAQTAEQVVETAFRAIKKSQPTVISGWLNRTVYCLERLMPHRLLLFLVHLYQRLK
jgi:uncharacterized protein